MGPQLLLFTMQSLLRLGASARSAYIGSVRDASLTLPLLDFKPEISIDNILRYYRVHYKESENDTGELKTLVRRLRDTGPDEEIRKALPIYYYQTELYLQSVKKDISGSDKYKEGSDLSAETLGNLFIIRQNSLSTHPGISVLRRMGGAFLEIGIDYFNQVPASLNINSREGLAMKALFTSMDHVRFSETEWNSDLKELPRRFTVSLLESVHQQAELFTENINVQKLIEVSSRGLLSDVKDFFADNANTEEKTAAVSLAEIIFRSVLKHAGPMVANDPQTFLGIDNQHKGALVSDLSKAVFAMMLSTRHGELSSAFNHKSADELIKTAFGTISRHPELIAGDDNIKVHTLVAQISGELAKPEMDIDKRLIPDVVRLIIQKSEANIEMLWPKNDDQSHGKHLLLVASKELLSRLARKPTDGTPWKLRLTRHDLSRLMDTTLTEVAANPAWVIERTGVTNTYLAEALDSMLNGINHTGPQHLSSEAGRMLLRTGLRAVAQRLEFLNKNQHGKTFLQQLFTTVLTRLLKDDSVTIASSWQFAKAEILTTVMEMALEQLSKTKINKTALDKIDSVIVDLITGINAGEALDLQALKKKMKQRLQTNS